MPKRDFRVSRILVYKILTALIVVVGVFLFFPKFVTFQNRKFTVILVSTVSAIENCSIYCGEQCGQGYCKVYAPDDCNQLDDSQPGCACVPGSCGCVANYEQQCNINACGTAGGTVECDGSCSGATPAVPQCRAQNVCGTWGPWVDSCNGLCDAPPTGTYNRCSDYACQQVTPQSADQCSDTCSQVSNDPIAGQCSCSANMGSSCQSTNACGQTNTGTYDCNENCSVSAPPLGDTRPVGSASCTGIETCTSSGWVASYSSDGHDCGSIPNQCQDSAVC